MGPKHILHMLTPLQHMSPFDVNMALDAGYDAVLPYANVTVEEITGLVQDAIFSRPPDAGVDTGIFIAGKDVSLALDVAASELYDKAAGTYRLDGKTVQRRKIAVGDRLSGKYRLCQHPPACRTQRDVFCIKRMSGRVDPSDCCVDRMTIKGGTSRDSHRAQNSLPKTESDFGRKLAIETRCDF